MRCIQPLFSIVSYPCRSDFKLVVVVDDSDSVSCATHIELPNTFTLLQMGEGLWPEARDALAGVSELSRLKRANPPDTCYGIGEEYFIGV